MKKRDLTGHKFSMLITKGFHHRGRHGLSFYTFVCSCGKEKVLCGTDVSQGKTKSCGCNRKTYNSEAHKRLPSGQAALNNLYCAYRGGAKSRGLEFSLTIEEFSALTKEDCKYCGIEPTQIWTGTSKKCSPYTYNGVDRVQNEQGYTSCNTVPCCKVCNQAKHNMKLNDFIAWLDRVVQFRTRESSAFSAGAN